MYENQDIMINRDDITQSNAKTDIVIATHVPKTMHDMIRIQATPAPSRAHSQTSFDGVLHAEPFWLGPAKTM